MNTLGQRVSVWRTTFAGGGVGSAYIPRPGRVQGPRGAPFSSSSYPQPRPRREAAYAIPAQSVSGWGAPRFHGAHRPSETDAGRLGVGRYARSHDTAGGSLRPESRGGGSGQYARWRISSSLPATRYGLAIETSSITAPCSVLPYPLGMKGMTLLPR